MPPTPAANRFDGAKNRAAPSHVPSAAACEYVDLTKSQSPSPSLGPAARETGPSRDVIDLTTVDNPCYDPNETGYIPNRQKEEGTDTVPVAQKEGSVDSYADEFLDDNAESLIEMADRVEFQAAAAAGRQTSANSKAGSSSSGVELCPVCKKGRCVKKTIHHGNKAQVPFRCSDATCRYEELDD